MAAVNMHQFDTTAVEKLLGWLALTCIVVLLVALTSCTVCPDQQCPVFPNAMPRQ